MLLPPPFKKPFTLDQIASNRKTYLAALRSDKYTKGTIKSDSLGRPVIFSEEDDKGYCACAIMIDLFSPITHNYRQGLHLYPART